MDCATFQAKIEEFRERTLDPAAEKDARDHLAGCRDCRAALAELDGLDRRLRSALEGLAPAPGFEVRVLSRIAAGGARPGFVQRIPLWAQAALAAAACVVAAVSIWLAVPHDRAPVAGHETPALPPADDWPPPEPRSRSAEPSTMAPVGYYGYRETAGPAAAAPSGGPAAPVVPAAPRPASAEFPVGKAFVAGAGEPRPYDGKTYISILRVHGGAPEIVVDAFPDRAPGKAARGPQNARTTVRREKKP